MADTKTYTCEFEIPSGSSELTLEADFELTDEELQQAIDALEKYDYRFNHVDNGWKINLGRGLDIFDKVERYSLDRVSQEDRRCKACSIAFVREEDEE